MNTTNEPLDLGCMEEMPFVLLDLGPGFLLCSSVGCCSFKHIFSKVLRGGCWISFFGCIASI